MFSLNPSPKKSVLGDTALNPILQMNPLMAVGLSKWSDSTDNTHGLFYPDQGVLDTTKQSAIATALGNIDDVYSVDDEVYSHGEVKNFVAEDYFQRYKSLLKFSVKANTTTTSSITFASIDTNGVAAPYQMPMSKKMIVAEKISTTLYIGILDPVNELRVVDTTLGNVLIGDIQEIDTNKFAFIYRDGTDIKARIATVDSALAITWGTAVTLAASTSAFPDTVQQYRQHGNACKLDTDKFAVVYHATTTYVVACTVSGTTITAGTPQSLTSGVANVGVIQPLGTDKVAIVWRDTATKFRVATLSGTVFTFGADISLCAGLNQASGMFMYPISTSLCAVAYGAGSTIETVTISGTTATTGGNVTITGSTPLQGFKEGYTTRITSDTSKFVLIGSSYMYLIGTSAGVTTIHATSASISGYAIFSLGTDSFGVVTYETNYYVRRVTVNLAGDTITISEKSQDTITITGTVISSVLYGTIGDDYVVLPTNTGTARYFSYQFPYLLTIQNRHHQ